MPLNGNASDYTLSQDTEAEAEELEKAKRNPGWTSCASDTSTRLMPSMPPLLPNGFYGLRVGRLPGWLFVPDRPPRCRLAP